MAELSLKIKNYLLLALIKEFINNREKTIKNSKNQNEKLFIIKTKLIIAAPSQTALKIEPTALAITSMYKNLHNNWRFVNG